MPWTLQGFLDGSSEQYTYLPCKCWSNARPWVSRPARDSKKAPGRQPFTERQVPTIAMRHGLCLANRVSPSSINERGRFMITRHSPCGARNLRRALSMILLAASTGFAAAQTVQAQDAFIPKLVNSTTVPSNGDLNPYGVAFVPEGFPSGGLIAAGDVLVANFNSNVINPNTGNTNQGTGTTITQLTPTGSLAPPGAATTFFTSTLTGLRTDLGALRG